MKPTLKSLGPAAVRGIRMVAIMLPAILIGWWLFPITTITYFNWIVVCLLVFIWDDVMEIKDKLK